VEEKKKMEKKNIKAKSENMVLIFWILIKIYCFDE
jgi:hypothetical protein